MHSSKIKIAWLHTHFLYSAGGTRYVFEVAKRLNSKYEITIFVERTSEYWKRIFEKEGIKICELLPRSSNSPLYWLLFPYYVRKEARILKEKIAPFTLLVTSMFPMNWVAGQLGKPHIQLCVEPFAFFYDQNLIDNLSFFKRIAVKIFAKFYRFYDLTGVFRSERLLTLNKAVAEHVRRIYGRDPSGVTYIGVDINFFKPTPNGKLEKKYKGKKIVLHSTDYSPLKGTDFVIEAFAKVVKEVREAFLLITQVVDNPAVKKKLQKRARVLDIVDRIEFIGHVPCKILPDYYTLADIFVFAGHPESKGASQASLGVIEALACETPVVRSIGNEEEVINGKSGFLVDPRDSEVLSRAIIKILTDPKLAQEMGKEGRKWVAANYNWERVAEIFAKNIEILTKSEQKGFSLIRYKGKTLGMVFRNYLTVRGIQFFTDDMNPFQVGIHGREKGVVLKPHIHQISSPLIIDKIQEILLVQLGRIRVTFYTDKGEKVKAVILKDGDAVLFTDGGHGVDFLTEAKIFEVKQGPYPGTEHAKIYIRRKNDSR